MNALITEEELADRLRVSNGTISRMLTLYRDRLGEKQGVFRLSRRTLRFDPALAVPAISKAYREHSRAKAKDEARGRLRFESFEKPSELVS